jgi:deoxyribonuclease V
MLACVDADYRPDCVAAACLLFESWQDAVPQRELVAFAAPAAEYRPGHFYRRELPALLAVLEQVSEPLELVLVDGYVWLGRDRPGLGFHLWQHRAGRHAVLGVAKNAFAGNDVAAAVMRGESARPLYVTSEGMNVDEAARHVREMHGPYRVPTLLKRVDTLCRTAEHGQPRP